MGLSLSSLGLGLTTQRGGLSEWTPANLFLSGEHGAWYDFSDLSTMWTSVAKVTQVANDGDLVGWVSDLSGNDYHLSIPDAGRPTYRTDGTRHWLEFANDKQLGAVHNTDISDFLIGISAREDVRSNSIPYSVGRHNEVNPHRLFAHMPYGDGNYYFDTYDNSTGRITGLWPKSLGQDTVVTHERTGSAIKVFESGISLGTATNGTLITRGGPGTTIYLGSGGNVAYYTGRVYGFCVVLGTYSAQDRSNLETYMALQAGVTL